MALAMEAYSPLRARTNSVSSASFRSDTAQIDMPSRIQWNVEPSQGSDLNGGERGTALPGDEHVDRVPTPQIHECRDRTTLEIVEAATGDGKPQPGEIRDGRREVELAEEPGLDGVAAAIGRREARLYHVFRTMVKSHAPASSPQSDEM